MLNFLLILILQLTSSPSQKEESATLDLFSAFTASQRVCLIFESVPFVSLLFDVASIAYIKAAELKKSAAAADAATETKSCGEDSSMTAALAIGHDAADTEDEEDSVGLLGFLEETLAAEQAEKVR